MSIKALHTALIASAVAHGAAIAWVGTHPGATPTPAHASIPSVTLVDITPEPMTVALLDDHSVVAAATVPSPSARSRVRPGNHLASQPGTTGIEVATPSATVAPTHPPGDGTSGHSLLTMRGPTIDRGPSAEFERQFLASSRPLPAEVPRSGELHPDGQGMKSEHKAFTIKVAADGTVDIHDKPNWQQKSLFHAEFDVTDAMMRRHGMDPYASYKLKVLDQTRAERVEIGNRYRTQQLARAPELVRHNIDQLWSSTADLAARKQGLFELWDDCAESGSDELIVAGRSARAYVIGFIRSKLPAESADAFSASEVARLNRRRKSQVPFAPY